MANRMFHPASGSLEIGHVNLWCSITIGASGAVSSSSGKGIASVVKESAAGQYTITLSDSYNSLLWGGVTLLHSTDSDPATVGVHTRLNSQAVSSATPTVVLQCFAGDDGADADPASGAVLLVKLDLKNSTV